MKYVILHSYKLFIKNDWPPYIWISRELLFLIGLQLLHFMDVLFSITILNKVSYPVYCNYGYYQVHSFMI